MNGVCRSPWRGMGARGLALTVLLALGVAGWWPLSAQNLLDLGASPNFVGSGARALGQGNAFIAVADDATAASWNPGGLTQLEKPELSLAMEAFRRRSDMTASDDTTLEATDTVSLADLNYLSMVYPFRVCARQAVVSLNYLKQYRFDARGDFPYALREETPWGPDFEGFSNIHMRFRQEGTLSSLSPAFAMEVTDRLSLGLAINIWNDEITGDSSFSYWEHSKGNYGISYQGTPMFTDQQDIVCTDTYTVDQGYSLTLGTLYRLTERWTFGAVAKPPFTLHLEHDQTYTDYVTPSMSERGQEDADLEFPWVLGAGVAFRPSDPWTLSGDVTWSQWSQYALDMGGRDWNPVSGNPLGISECNDTLTTRLGAEYLILRPSYIVPLRCGVGIDPAPAANDRDRYYVGTLGTGFQKGRYAFDVAYEMRVGKAVNGSAAVNLNASQDVVQHRVLASVIMYY